jgi:hypothetical protein
MSLVNGKNTYTKIRDWSASVTQRYLCTWQSSKRTGAHSMKPFLAKFSIVLVVLGFLWPPLWIIACITGILWIGATNPGVRPDGKRRSGGLLGPLWDDFVVSRKMVKCPYCRTLIFRDASKCRQCGEWVHEPQNHPDPRLQIARDNNQIIQQSSSKVKSKTLTQ